MKDLKHYASILSLLIILSAVSVTSCTEDYGPEIDKLKEDVSSLKTSVDKLKEAYEGGKIISGVEPITTGIEGWKITFSDNTAITLKNGANGKDGIDGVTPYVKIDNNCNWIVSYDKGQTYSPIKDADGNTISAKGIDGANGVSVDVQVNSEGKYEIITYLEDKNNPLTVLPTPYSANPDNQISSIVEDSERGMVSITMSSGKQYNFGQALNYPTSIVLLKEEILISEENGIAEIEFYVNPSNAKITKDDIVINQIETDILKSYAESYAKPSPNYEIVSLENSVNEKGEKLKGQYKLTIKHIGESGLYGELCTLVISTKDAQDNKIEITSEKFSIINQIIDTDLTPEQKALIAGYKENLGIDLYRMLGKLNCSVKVSFPYVDGDDKNSFNDGNDSRTFTGETIITLSENATPEKPVLKMVSNPMGMNDFMFEMLRKNTTEDVYEFWYYYPYSIAVMNAAGYAPADDDKYMIAATETFEMTLDNIAIENGEITFVQEVEDKYGDLINSVPFEYNFSLWNKLQAKSEEIVEVDEYGDGEMVEYTMGELFEYGASMDPKQYLMLTTISEDYIENEPSDWVEPKAIYDFENGTFKFVFPFDMANSYGYQNVEVTYIMNK